MKQSITRRLIEKSSLELYSPYGILEELNAVKSEILKRSNRNEEEFEILKNNLLQVIHLVDHNIIKLCEKSASNLIGATDYKDIIYVATLLCTNAVGIWTNDADFEIPQISVYRTQDIMRYFGIDL